MAANHHLRRDWAGVSGFVSPSRSSMSFTGAGGRTAPVVACFAAAGAGIRSFVCRFAIDFLSEAIDCEGAVLVTHKGWKPGETG